MQTRRVWLAAAGCYFAVSAGNPALSQSSSLPAIVRTDGIYQAPSDQSNTFSYLRFYRDGAVSQCTSTGKPEDVAKWLSKTHAYSSHGMSASDGKTISFVTKSKSAVVDYDGTVEKDAMALKSYSHATKFRGTYRYRFIPVTFGN